MTAIYPISDLQKRPAEVKARAQHEVVHLTENGKGAYVLMSEEYFDRHIAREREDAAWEAGLIAAIDEGLRDIEQGRTYTLEETLNYIDELMDERKAAEHATVDLPKAAVA